MNKIIIIMFVMVFFLVGTVSALEFDNVKTYDEKTNTVTIKNMFGLGADIASTTLNTELKQVVAPGYNRNVANFTVTSYTNYENFISEIKYYDKKDNMKEIAKNVNIKYWGDVTVIDYDITCIDDPTNKGDAYDKSICTEKKTGEHVEKGWIDFSEKALKDGETLKIGLFTTVNHGDYVEWIPEFAGVKVDEWASWSGSLLAGLAACWDLDETSGTLVIDKSPGQLNNGTMNGLTQGVPSQIASLGTAYYFDGGGGNLIDMIPTASLNISDVTIGIIMNTTPNDGGDFGGKVNNYGYNLGIAGQKAFAKPVVSGAGDAVSSTSNVDTGGAMLIIGSHESANTSVWVNATLETTTGTSAGALLNAPTWQLGQASVLGNFVGYVSEVWVLNYSITQADATFIYNSGDIISCSALPNPTPFIDLIAPANGTIIYSPTIDLECKAYDDSGITNVSLLWDGTAEQTNNSGYNATNYNFTKTGFAVGTYEWSCEDYDDVNAINNTSPAFHITYANDLTITLNAPAYETDFSVNTIGLNETASDDTAIINVSLIINGTYNGTDTSGLNNTLVNFDRSLADGFYNWTMEACDAVSCENASPVWNFTIDTTNPTINITNPFPNNTAIAFHDSDNNQTINWTATDDNIDTCFIQYDDINRTVTCADNESSFELDDDRFAIFWVNDTFGNYESETIYWSYTFLQTGSSYNTAVNETHNESLSINLTIPATVTQISSFLKYNGTTIAADTDCTGTACYINSSLDIPLLTSGATYENKSFYWIITTLAGGSTSTLTTDTLNQNVSQINFSKCGTGWHAIDFNISEEHNSLPLVADFDATFKYWLGSGTVQKTETTSQSAASNYSFCIDPNETYYTTSNIFLEATGFESRNYNFIKKIYDSSSQRIQPLYLVNTSYETATDIIIEVSDSGLVPKQNILVNISRYFPATNTYHQVESQTTDEFGQFVAKLIKNDVRYKFEFYDADNTLLKTSDLVTVACRATICVLPFVIEGTLDDFERFETPALYTYDLTFDDTTNVVTFFWDDQTGDSTTTTFEVVRYNFNESTTVCSNSSTAALGTLICGLGSGTSSYTAQVYRTEGGDKFRIDELTFKVGVNFSTYGFEGLLWVFILLFTCIGIGAFNPSVGIGLYGAAFVSMGILGIISMPLTVFFANTILCVLFIWGINK